MLSAERFEMIAFAEGFRGVAPVRSMIAATALYTHRYSSTASPPVINGIYEDMMVQFADMPCTALIGTDLLNNGKLDVDSGQRLSFTYH